MSRYEQWNDLDNGYAATGRTVAKLVPGIYDLGLVQGIPLWITAEGSMHEIIRLPDTPIDEIVGEIETFWGREEAFRSHRLPYKRGILMHGPPGSGKTSALALVSQDVVKRGGVVALFDDPAVFLACYRAFRSIQPSTPIVVLMEDLDEILTNSSRESKVLNLLDGIEPTHKCIFLATTNYPERLGARITNRPSRFDRRFLVPHPNAESRRIYLDTIVQPGDAIDIDSYVKDTEGMSLAHVKELFVATVLLGTDYDETVSTLKAMKDRASSVYDDPGTAVGQYA